MNREYDLIVFDWDGTLMDSAAKIVRCFIQAATDVGFPGLDEVAIRNIIGLGLREALDALLPDTDEDLREQVAERYRQHFLHLDRTEMPLFPGVREGLEELTRKGYRLAVATGKARRGLDRVLKEVSMTHLFAATRCADEAGSKPHPRMLLDLLDQTGASANRALMVGDTVYDLQMARAAAMDSLAVSYGAHDRDRLLAYSPLNCFGSFPEVYAWLQ
jgi:phosphoglycolate phosphatase